MTDFNELVGKTIVDVFVSEAEDQLYFQCKDNTFYRLIHRQDGDEVVYLANGYEDLYVILGSEILSVEEIDQSFRVNEIMEKLILKKFLLMKRLLILILTILLKRRMLLFGYKV